MPEVRITKPMWIGGKPVEPDTVVDLPESDVAYQVSLGRVERIDAAPVIVDDKAVAKPVKAKK